MTRKLPLQLLMLFAFTLLFISCSDEDEKTFPFSHLHLNFFEHFHPNEREMVFFLQTNETFPCNNFLISTSVEQTPGVLEIHADNLDIPNICITSIGPATRSLFLGETDQLPRKVIFWVKEDKHDFDMNIHQGFINVKRHSEAIGRLSFSRDTLMRIPDNTVWGYVVKEKEKKVHSREKLMDEFMAHGAQPLTLEDGDYHYFEVEEEDVVFHSHDLNEKTQGFAFWFDKELDLLFDAFQQYAEENEQMELRIRLFNTRGERIFR